MPVVEGSTVLSQNTSEVTSRTIFFFLLDILIYVPQSPHKPSDLGVSIHVKAVEEEAALGFFCSAIRKEDCFPQSGHPSNIYLLTGFLLGNKVGPSICQDKNGLILGISENQHGSGCNPIKGYTNLSY